MLSRVCCYISQTAQSIPGYQTHTFCFLLFAKSVKLAICKQQKTISHIILELWLISANVTWIVAHEITVAPLFPMETEDAMFTCKVRPGPNITDGVITWYHGGYLVEPGFRVNVVYYSDVFYDYCSDFKLTNTKWTDSG